MRTDFEQRYQENYGTAPVRLASLAYDATALAAVLARTPHGYHDIAQIREELQRAGFADITIETREKVSRAPSARTAATAYCEGTPLRNEIEARDAGLLQLATNRATEAIAFRHGEGPVAGKIQAHVIVAVK